MRALVTGATGFIGRRLVRSLLTRGDSVRILARTEERAALFGGTGAQIVLGDLGEPDGLRDLARDIDVVFHLATVMKGSDAQFERVDVRGTEWLLQEAARQSVRRIVFASTLSAYPLASRPHGAVIDEQCELDESGRLGNYARSKVRAERAVLAAQRAGGPEGVIVRLGWTCGIGAAVLPSQVCRVVGPNLMLVFGSGNIPLPLTLIDNAIDALQLAATVPGIGGESFNIVDDEELTQRQYLQLYRQATGKVLRIVTLPRATYYLLGAASELAAALRGKEAATTRYRVRNRLRRVRWDSSKAHRVLGWQARVPLRAGLTEIFRSHASPPRAVPSHA